MNRVILKKIAQGCDINEWVIDGGDFNVRVVQRRSQHKSPNASKAVDAELHPVQ